jgi:myosin heavy subunit
MSSSSKKSIRFSQTTVNKNSQKALRRSSSFAKNLPRKTLNSKSTLSLEPSNGNPDMNHVWIEDENEKWILCQKLRQENSSILLKNPQTNQIFTFDSSFKEIFPHDPNVTSDMITLRGLSEPSILNNLKERSISKHPYTYMGTILISVNPFEWYDFPEVDQFKGKFLNPSTPHPYAIAGNSVSPSFVLILCSRTFLPTNLFLSCT